VEKQGALSLFLQMLFKPALSILERHFMQDLLFKTIRRN
jgi:hypothetical protein